MELRRLEKWWLTHSASLAFSIGNALNPKPYAFSLDDAWNLSRATRIILLQSISTNLQDQPDFLVEGGPMPS